MDCSLPGSSIHGIFQAGILSGLSFPSPRDPDPGMNPYCLSHQGRSSSVEILLKPSTLFLGFSSGSNGKESACNAGNLGLIPGSGRSPGEGNGNLLQYSCLENPMDRGAWWATVHGVTKSQTRLSNFTFTFSFS